MTTAPTRTATATEVELTRVSVRFASRRARTTALDDVSLRVRAGEFVSVVGPSGCGKSTLLKVVAGLVRPTVVLVTHSIAEAVFLGTRVLVMSPRPGRLLRNFDVDLPTERDYAAVMSDPRFERLAGQIRELLGRTAGG